MYIDTDALASGVLESAREREATLASMPGLLQGYLADIEWQQGNLQLNWAGYRLSSVFQPIVSFSHGCIVAHEALLRVNGQDGHGVPPSTLFSPLFGLDDLLHLDRASRLMHIINTHSQPGWYFLNLHPQLFDSLRHGDSLQAARAIGEFVEGSESRFVIEIVEEEITDHAHFEEGVAALRSVGLGIALDDFGAGHSNFDRVWKIRPDVVKLDCSFARRAAEDKAMRRLLPQIVSILHEAGTLVLLEGIETLDQAWIAMDANVDFGQGWYFARPAALPAVGDREIRPRIEQIWQRQQSSADFSVDHEQEQLSTYLRVVRETALKIALGEPLALAAAAWEALPHSASLYLLDAEGRQCGMSLEAGRGGPSRMNFCLGHVPGARWSRREYFVEAMRAPGEAQLTRPYLSVATGRICSTVSICIEQAGKRFVLCGDVDWAALEAAHSETGERS